MLGAANPMAMDAADGQRRIRCQLMRQNAVLRTQLFGKYDAHSAVVAADSAQHGGALLCELSVVDGPPLPPQGLGQAPG